MSKKFRSSALAALLLPVPLASSSGAAPEAARPNIVLIISDDQRWDTVGAAGNPNIRTPNQDRLAREGVHFLQATMNIPQCSPARAQLLTGLPPSANGWISNQAQRSDVARPDGFRQYRLLPSLLREGGYRTALVGKWHLDPDPWNCGFDEVGTWMPAGSGPYQGAQLARGKSREKTRQEGFTQELFTDSALEFLHGAGKGDKPFLLWLAYTAPHTPLKPNPPHIEKLYTGPADEELAPPGFEGEKKRKGGENHWRNYYRAISYLDEQVGRVLKTLDDQGLTTNTVVIYVGDNGYMMGNRGVAGKVVPYEGSVRVPLMIRAPGVAKVTGPTDAAASSLDLPPTLLKLAGLEPPKEWAGRSLIPVLQGEKNHGIDFAVSEFPDNENTKFGEAGYYMVRTPRYKLIDWMTESRPDEFYSLAADPQEKRNLYADPEVRAERDKLQSRLDSYRKATAADAPTTATWIRNKK